MCIYIYIHIHNIYADDYNAWYHPPQPMASPGQPLVPARLQPLRQGSAVSPLCEVGHGSRGSHGVAEGAGGNLPWDQCRMVLYGAMET